MSLKAWFTGLPLERRNAQLCVANHILDYGMGVNHERGNASEEAMSTVVTNVRKNRGSFWVVVIAGGAIATLAGLATVESVLFTTIRADARVAATQTPRRRP